MIQETNRPTIISDFIWSLIERIDLENTVVLNNDYRVRIMFNGSGYTLYDGHESIVATSHQIMGTQGLSVNVREADFKEDLNVQRTIFKLFVVLPKGVRPAATVKGIEKAMDRRKLDLSYQIPEILPVQ
jgi:hypothetical protein